ncbi:MAG: TIGR00730 family Rossman fold protein [Bifidobacterium sp.]|nr:TIGR00730 family Rossman fold protein [Bifidobacterium sp.]MCH4174913.1 TIGR00730 family Rossman fold protein [Bifidobacterium sp.]
MSRNIVVYCGAASGNSSKFEVAATAVANWIVDNDGTLVYGGGSVGLMGIVAARVLERGGKVHGVIPELLRDRGTAMKGLTELSVVPDMTARKHMMLELGDVCLALPGGPGTLEEISEAFSWARLGLNANPCIFVDVDHFWEPLANMFDNMVSNGFLSQEDRDRLLFTSTLSSLNDWIASYTPPKIRQYHVAAAATDTTSASASATASVKDEEN